MGALVYLPLLLSGVFGAAAPALARRLRPHLGTWLLSAGAVLSAGASSVSIGLLALVFLARNPLVGAQAHWSEASLRANDPYPAAVGVLATAAVAVLAARFVRVLLARVRATRLAYRLAGELAGPAGELTVVESPAREAFAVPGRPGRIVATSALLRCLDPAQRRAVLAHERAHLRHRHHLHQTATVLAAAVNPLLRALPAATAQLSERWADEDATRECRRGTVADALTRSAGGPSPRGLAVILHAATTAVHARVRALHQPPPGPAPLRLAVLLALLLASTAAILLALQNTDQLFDLARAAYRAGLR